jgi:hypothetical protein
VRGVGEQEDVLVIIKREGGRVADAERSNDRASLLTSKGENHFYRNHFVRLTMGLASCSAYYYYYYYYFHVWGRREAYRGLW